ncbi:MAG: hypothetical protein PHW87_13005 [Methanothrix sp.]|nr:hypothetical protein [Methanothrix sp.]
MTALSAAAAQEKYVCSGADLGSYAKFGFCLPEQVEVVGDTIAEENYTGGREIAASMLLDGNRVELHLLYPCQAPQKELEPAELKPFLEAYDPILAQATYNESVTGPALLGQIGNRNFFAYQPKNNQTVALMLMDVNMSGEMKTIFLDNLSIAVNEGAAPPSNCPDTTAPTLAPATASVQNNTIPSVAVANDVVTPAETGKEKMAADMEAARAKLEDMRKKMRR